MMAMATMSTMVEIQLMATMPVMIIIISTLILHPTMQVIAMMQITMTAIVATKMMMMILVTLPMIMLMTAMTAMLMGWG